MAAFAHPLSACLQNFVSLLADLSTAVHEHRVSMPPEKVRNEYSRLKTRSGDLGALQSGRSSLAFRL
ncbi:hypothetical protein K469DRAFT_544368 [Zopfia rhizophila CBS 207.26]|uniref:NACHT-NTPase and P-loop NTPases N-terminal domain-containing protein n=1 Tax=Zopfia rhizophila CBS 207.26 TaxID=1314779 RepID=A0A6A6EV96_9PEZI|nr:hypothetical protein K469DRAFT_544368 [Zopfia rhizophila CBS 207.26]